MGNDYYMKQAGIAKSAMPEDLGVYLVCYLCEHFY